MCEVLLIKSRAKVLNCDSEYCKHHNFNIVFWSMFACIIQLKCHVLCHYVTQSSQHGCRVLSVTFFLCSLNSITSEEAKRHSVKSMGSESSSSGQSSLLTVDIKNFKALWNEEVYQNRERWKAQACKGTVHLYNQAYNNTK